jgi:hypothetical protein
MIPGTDTCFYNRNRITKMKLTTSEAVYDWLPEAITSMLEATVDDGGNPEQVLQDGMSSGDDDFMLFSCVVELIRAKNTYLQMTAYGASGEGELLIVRDIQSRLALAYSEVMKTIESRVEDDE